MAPIDDLRARIDSIDDELLALLERRADVAADLAKAERDASLPSYDPVRERATLDRLVARGAGRLPGDAIRAIYREILSACVALDAPLRVAFLGPPGSFGHAAARQIFGLATRYTEATTNEGVFDAVRRGAATYGVVPIENSTEGSVSGVVDALLEGGVLIHREVILDVAQCLMTQATGLTSIERVYSHPQALAQCRVWLGKHLGAAQLVQTSSTSAAAREALSDPAGAAVGSRLAADVYGLPVLRERIQDIEENATRFVVIAAEDAPPTGDDKTTLAFAVIDARGALRRVLEVFDDAGVNLSRLESRPRPRAGSSPGRGSRSASPAHAPEGRPSKQKAWDYVFLVDLEGHREEPRIQAALTAVAARCVMVQNLGSYPRFRPPTP